MILCITLAGVLSQKFSGEFKISSGFMTFILCLLSISLFISKTKDQSRYRGVLKLKKFNCFLEVLVKILDGAEMTQWYNGHLNLRALLDFYWCL